MYIHNSAFAGKNMCDKRDVRVKHGENKYAGLYGWTLSTSFRVCITFYRKILPLVLGRLLLSALLFYSEPHTVKKDVNNLYRSIFLRHVETKKND